MLAFLDLVTLKLTDLQILGCELHQNAFGGRAAPGRAGRTSVALDHLAIINGQKCREIC